MSSPLHDEIISLNAIYTSTTLTPTPTSNIYTLTLPTRPITFRVQFSPYYPSQPPLLLGLEIVGLSTPKGLGKGNHVLSLAHEVLDQVYRARSGEVCLYDFVEELGAALDLEGEVEGEGKREDDSERGSEGVPDVKAKAKAKELKEDATTTITTSEEDQMKGGTGGEDISPPIAPPLISFPWTHSPTPTIIKKSTFIAHMCPITDPSSIPAALSSLLNGSTINNNPNTSLRLRRATHNISAYRIRTTSTTTSTSTSRDSARTSVVVYQDSDDDGETAAGRKLLHLLQIMDVWNVLVVVSRWYGGVRLGPERFRVIGAVAREVLVEGGMGVA